MEKESKYRKYNQQQLQKAVKLVRNEGKTIYKAAKEADVPWSTLKRYLGNEEESVRKMGRPYALSCDLELRLYNYIIEMQELGFGLTVYQIRKYAYDLAEVAGRENFLLNANENIVQENLQPQPSTSGRSAQKANKAKQSNIQEIEDDWECGLCEALYSADVKKRNGAKWIQCSYCLTPYHEICVSIEDSDPEIQLYFRCERCM